MQEIVTNILNVFFNFFKFIIEYWLLFLIAILLLILFYKSINFYLLGFYKKVVISSVTGFLIFLFSWLFIGYVHIPYDDNDTIPHFFLKNKPTFQLEFFDIYLQDGNIPKFERLDQSQKQQQINYCQYRYGIEITNDNELIYCIKKIYPNVDVNNPNG